MPTNRHRRTRPVQSHLSTIQLMDFLTGPPWQSSFGQMTEDGLRAVYIQYRPQLVTMGNGGALHCWPYWKFEDVPAELRTDVEDLGLDVDQAVEVYDRLVEQRRTWLLLNPPQ